MSDDISVMSDEWSFFLIQTAPMELFGFWCFHNSSLSFSHSSFKNGGSHGAIACLDMFSDFVFITQFSPKWVMNYGNWKQVWGVFRYLSYELHGNLVIKWNLWDLMLCVVTSNTKSFSLLFLSFIIEVFPFFTSIASLAEASSSIKFTKSSDTTTKVVLGICFNHWF